MKKGQQVEGVVTRVDFPNKGIVQTDDGDLITVKNVLEGQRILCVIKKTRKGKAEGRLLEVVKKSPLEMDVPACKHFDQCGGCSYQTLPYEEQVALKGRQIKRLLEPVLPDNSFDDLFEGVIPSPNQFAYRNKMEFSFGDAYFNGPLSLGMHKRGSFYDIVTVDGCQIIDEDMRCVLMETLAYFQERGANYYHKMRHEGYLRHLLVRKAAKTGEILVDLVTSSDARFLQKDATEPATEVQADALEALESELLQGWSKRLQEVSYDGKLTGVLHTRNDRPADVVENQGTRVLFGQAYFYEELLGLRFRITPFSFFQTNSLGAEKLYETARDFITAENADILEGKTVYDLYSGTGTIAQILAPVSGHVIGVEIVEEAVEAAKKNALENGLTNCDFIAGDVLKVIDEIEEKPDYIVLDPPRDGIHPKALDKIIAYGVESMIYISCKPTSLARDLEVLQASGYQVKRICCCDMFAGTPHVESVVLLSQQKADDYLEVEIDLDELDATSAETKATYEEIKKYVAEHND
ncbi:MAG: 23S rRNA (uracil(1939)-C(5))-methyltransferase RlmD, partial [Roseburia lenta]|nr:23S rRNA (uracil(1939)-C(5))-methyltransferase RlmD [Roseburia lenta]